MSIKKVRAETPPRKLCSSYFRSNLVRSDNQTGFRFFPFEPWFILFELVGAHKINETVYVIPVS